jgi:hypothetical protein
MSPAARGRACGVFFLQCVRVGLHFAAGMMGQESVLDLPVLAIKRVLAEEMEQAEHKCSNGCDEAGAEPHNILCVVGEVVAWQCAPKE